MIFFDLGQYGQKNSYITSNGSFSQILQINKDLNLVLILLGFIDTHTKHGCYDLLL
jgi:hypothetical protein